MKLFLLVLVFLSPVMAFGSWNNTYEFQTWAVHDSIETDTYGDPYAHDDSISSFQGSFRYRHGSFVFTADPQVRALLASVETHGIYPVSMYEPSIQAPIRFLKLESVLAGTSAAEAQASWERLTVGVKNQSTELVIGRQPFSLGVMKIVPIWNRFVVNLPVPGVFLQFPNRDGIAFRHQYGNWSLQAFSILERQNENNAYLLENIFNIRSVELHVLMGQWAQNLSGGAAMSVPFLGGSLRGEFLGVGGRTTDPIHMYQYGFGFETAFSASWKATLESLYLSTGATSTVNYDSSQLNEFQPLLAQAYVVLKLKYDSGQFYTFEPQIIVNVIDGSTIVGGEFIYSLGDHAEVGLEASVPTGGTGQEFSNNAPPIETFGPSGTPQQFYARYRLTY